jgi:ketosteroid isomerase-like protein
MPASREEERIMKQAMSLVALAALVSLSTSMSACGQESGRPATTQVSSSTSDTGKADSLRARPSGSYWRHDGDADDHEAASRHPEADDKLELDAFGHRASHAEREAISALVRRYYAAAAAGDSTTVCALLSPAFATQLGNGSSNSGRNGTTTCSKAVAPLLTQQHEQLTALEASTMIVTDVRLKGSTGLAVLGFRRMPQSTILVEREGIMWRLGQLFGNELA